ncbi:hypothetical protein [Phreatobacter sp.]|uniref:hypothetical protein n=1 Tax=Phreatobacter sp. TaxID=1966341 RepID=UPI0025E962FC|nr:hypothetical protein [Phreatobacter sp.]
MSNTRFKAVALAAVLTLSLGSSLSGAMAQSAGGGGSAGDGGGGSMGYDAPSVTHAAVPGTTIPRPGQVREQNTLCGFELLRGHYCERRVAR